MRNIFLLTHPVWDVTKVRRELNEIKGISTHTSRVGCDAFVVLTIKDISISTHTSRVGCD